MSLRYALRPNALDNDPNAHVASVVAARSMTLDDIISEMISRGSTVTRAEALSVLEEYSLAVKALLCRGHRVNTPLHNFRLSIQGVFEDEDAPFEPGRHRVRVNISPGQYLRDIGPLVTLERVSLGRVIPEPLRFRDMVTDQRNSVVTPGGLGRLTGKRLKYDEADPAQGIFFIDDDSAETRVEVFENNTPRKLAFLIPSTLAAGTYRLEVRAELFDTGVLRTGVLAYPLTVS